MDIGTESISFLLVGLLIVVLAGSMHQPAGETVMVSELVSEGDHPPDADIVEYTDLPEPAQTVVDETIAEDYTFFSSYDNYAASESLRGDKYIRKNGQVYRIRTTSGDDGDGLFAAIARDLSLAIGGLLAGTAVYLADRKRRLVTLAAFPVGATAAVVGMNAIAAPDPSVVAWLGNTLFGLAAGVPIQAGVAVRRRSRRIGAVSAGTLALSVIVLFSGDTLSGLYLLVPLVLLGVPGIGFGWWLGKRSRVRS
ncbi:hypothetical protein [Haloarchaeobius sp. FL176]|uniref:hypothetical protein n=1 Tax=Haloarchaeobius sp. FL176 TaxID=2967129 RepID=UPI002148643D|nr:hypothetical protein [Haloarchaeobius sp. FL176]